MNYVWLRKTPRIIQSAGYGTTLLFDLLNFPTPTTTPSKTLDGFFSHGSTAVNMVKATMDAQLNPSTQATCPLPQCGWNGVYFFKIDNSDNSKPIPDELVVAAWKQSVDSGYTRGGMMVAKLVGRLVYPADSQYIVKEGEIATKKPSSKARQYCAHPSCIQYIHVILEENILRHTLDAHLKENMRNYDSIKNQSLPFLENFLKEHEMETGGRAKLMMHVQNAVVQKASTNPHTGQPKSHPSAKRKAAEGAMAPPWQSQSQSSSTVPPYLPSQIHTQRPGIQCVGSKYIGPVPLDEAPDDIPQPEWTQDRPWYDTWPGCDDTPHEAFT